VSLEEIDPFPWFLHQKIELKISGKESAYVMIRASEWTEQWRPLLGQLSEFIKLHPKRMMMAIAGPPGSGKTFLAAQLVWLAEHGFLRHGTQSCQAVALPMDGFHYPDPVLAKRELVMKNGEKISLVRCKGSPETFDVEALKKHLLQLRGRPATMTWPDYDRVHHMPMPGAIKVHDTDNLVIVEGNYLLLNMPPYEGISDFFHVRMYVEASAGAMIANLMNRHMEGGKTMEGSKDWIKRIDLPNARLVEMTRGRADVIVRRDSEEMLSEINWKTDGPFPAAGKE
jgi:putative kinase